MNALISFCLRKRVTVLLLTALLVACSVFVIRKIPVDVFPELKVPRVTIQTEASGLSAEEVERYVTIPVESAMNGTAGVKSVRSSSGGGLSFVWVDFDWDTDIYLARQIVAERLSGVRAALPQNVSPELAPIVSVTGEIMLIALTPDASAKNLPEAEKKQLMLDMRQLAEYRLRNRLLAVPGVGQVTVLGGRLPEYQVIYDPAKLRQAKISFADLTAAVEAAGSAAPAGYLENAAGMELPIQQESRVETTEHLRRALVPAHLSGTAKIEDLAEVRIDGAPRRGNAGFLGDDAVILSVQKVPGANKQELTRALDQAVREFSVSQLPPGMALHADAYRQSDLMVWSTTASGTALEQINATLTHVRASYSLLPAVKMILDNTSQSAISYVPNSLGDVVFQDGKGEYIYPYRAEDGSFRYILPTDYKGTIRWFYSYEEKRYGGTWEPTTGVTANTRYSRVEVLKDFGEYTIDKAQLGDLYCRDAQGKGYLLPSEAASAGIDYECVGVVFALGHSQYDTSDYSATGIGQEKCHGYAVALSEAETNLFIGWGTRNTALDLYPEGVDNLNNPDQDWDGYLYTRKIVTHVGGEEMLKPMSGENKDGYPATYYAVVAYKNLVAAPTNSSGWFLPAIGQLLEVFRQGHFVTTVGDPLRSNAYYWSSSEDANRPAQYALRGYITEIKALQSDKWNPYSGGNGWVRSVLAF